MGERREKIARQERENAKLGRSLFEPLQNMYSYLPDHIILDHILPRLPVKTLIRFKSVCKDWRSFISSSQFQKSHLQISSSRHHFLLNSALRSFFLLPCDEQHGSKTAVKLNDEFFSGCFVNLVGCCNGLVCLNLYDNIEKMYLFLLWNPATREYRKSYSPDQRYPFFFGFGYASLLEDYNIICAYKYNGVDQDADIYVFSLRDDSWKRIDNLRDQGIVFEDSFDIVQEGLFFDDTLYWCIYATEENYACILGFQLVNEQFKETARMNLVSDYMQIKVHVINRSLALQCFGFNNCASDVWIRKQHGNFDWWHKVFSVPPRMRLLGFSPKGECLMQEREEGSLVMFVDLSRVASVTSFSELIYQSGHHVESLISPWNNYTTKADEEDMISCEQVEKEGIQKCLFNKPSNNMVI